MDEAAAVYIRGDVYRYVSLFDHPDDYTLMPPYGARPGAGNLAVLAAVEHRHGEVGGLPDQDWSLRVTLVFRGAVSGGSSCTATPTRW